MRKRKQYWFKFGANCISLRETSPLDAPCEGTLLFLHGRFGSSSLWDPLIFELASHYRCLNFDLPGFGRSFTVEDQGLSLAQSAELAIQILGKFVSSEDVAFMIGHDVGGAIAQLVLTHSPVPVGGLVLINSASVTRAADGLDAGWLGWKYRLRLRRLVRGVTYPLEEATRRSLRAGWSNPTRLLSQARALQRLAETWPLPFERRYWKHAIRRLPLPVLVLWGGKDPVNPVETGFELARILPDSTFFQQSECGHWPFLESPDWVLLKLREFFFRVSLARDSVSLARRSLSR